MNIFAASILSFGGRKVVEMYRALVSWCLGMGNWRNDSLALQRSHSGVLLKYLFGFCIMNEMATKLYVFLSLDIETNMKISLQRTTFGCAILPAPSQNLALVFSARAQGQGFNANLICLHWSYRQFNILSMT